MDTEPLNLVSSSSAATALTASCRSARTTVDETDLLSLLPKVGLQHLYLSRAQAPNRALIYLDLPSPDPKQQAPSTGSTKR